MDGEQDRWNHNIHYHPFVLAAVPDGSERGLDVGCGEGVLARELRRIVPHVSAIDLDDRSIDLARQQDAGAGVRYISGDFLSADFEPDPFDVIVSVAALHHMDAVSGLERMRQPCARAERWSSSGRLEVGIRSISRSISPGRS